MSWSLLRQYINPAITLVTSGMKDVLDQAHPAIDQTAYMDARKKYHKTACTSLPADEHVDVRNMSKTL
jgi:hypothetical protein